MRRIRRFKFCMVRILALSVHVDAGDLILRDSEFVSVVIFAE